MLNVCALMKASSRVLFMNSKRTQCVGIISTMYNVKLCILNYTAH